MFYSFPNVPNFQISNFYNFKVSKSILKSAVLPASLMPLFHLSDPVVIGPEGCNQNTQLQSVEQAILLTKLPQPVASKNINFWLQICIKIFSEPVITSIVQKHLQLYFISCTWLLQEVLFVMVLLWDKGSSINYVITFGGLGRPPPPYVIL